MNDRKVDPGAAEMDVAAPVCFIGCPKRVGQVCTAWVKPAPDAPWTNHGTQALPTLEPSYHCTVENGGCGYHGFVVDGKLVDAPQGVVSSLHVCAKCKHPEMIAVAVNPSQQPGGKVAIGIALRKIEVRKPSGIIT